MAVYNGHCKVRFGGLIEGLAEGGMIKVSYKSEEYGDDWDMSDSERYDSERREHLEYCKETNQKPFWHFLKGDEGGGDRLFYRQRCDEPPRRGDIWATPDGRRFRIVKVCTAFMRAECEML